MAYIAIYKMLALSLALTGKYIMEFHTGPEWDERVITLKPAKKIGVLLSSGMDSTTLFKLLYTKFPETSIRIFNVQTSEDTSKPVIDELLKQMNVDLDRKSVV